MPSEKSVSWWIECLKENDEEAAERLWHRYFDKLVRLARQRLSAAARRDADEEDVALSVFRCLCDGAAQGRLSRLSNRDELWRLLVAMTVQKAIDRHRLATPQKRGAGRVRGESALGVTYEGKAVLGLDQLAGDEPTPEVLAILAEEHNRLLGKLPGDALKQTAIWRMEGYANKEIAQKLGVTGRSVERKLERIRNIWLREFGA